MNKSDKIFIGIVFACAILFYIPLFFMDMQASGKEKEVVVSFKNEEILRVSAKKNGIYPVNGTLGKVEVEVKDGAVRVEKENSPYHLCSIQGWVEETERPIICLPNNIVVEMESSRNSDDGLDTVIQ